MTLASYIALTIAVLVLAVTPGPVVVATVARSLVSGLAPALAFALGVAAVDLGYLLLAIYGLSAISNVMGELFIVIKIVGAAYLFYLGIRLWLARAEPLGEGMAPPPRPFWRSFSEGALVDLANPKIILFYAAFLPTFADLDMLETAIQRNQLPPTGGFFFGKTTGDEKDDDLAFIAEARAHIAARRHVYYTAWW